MERERTKINKMKVVLVLPPAEKISEKKDTPTHQHVGLGYLAAVLERNGIYVTVIDAKLDLLNFNQTIEAIKAAKPDVVGITAMTHEINMAAQLAKSLKEEMPGSFIVVGGVHVTALPIETLKQYNVFDMGIMGEGERSFLDVLMSIQRRDGDFSHISGIVYKKNGNILVSRPPDKLEDVNQLPFPAWDKFPRAKDYIIITSRGCPFSCIFCMRALGQQVRKRSPLNVVAEMENVIARRKPGRFLFYDETFTLDKKHVYEICDLIKQKGINNDVRWSATTRVDSVDKDILLKMKEAGCDHIEFGVESGNQEVLKKIKKGITLQQARHAVSLAKELGFHTETAFILGHPDETVQTAYETISFASELNADIVQLGIMVPYPGTEVAQIANKGMGGYKVISNNWSDFNKQLGNALELKELSRKDLERLQLAGYLRLFFFNKRFLDLARFVLNFRREMFAFFKNHFKKHKTRQSSKVGLLLMLSMIFKKSPEL